MRTFAYRLLIIDFANSENEVMDGWHTLEHSRGGNVWVASGAELRSGENHFPDIIEENAWFLFHNTCMSIVEIVLSLKSQTQSGETRTGLDAIYKFYVALDSLREDIREDQEAITGKGVEWWHGYYGSRRFWFDGASKGWSMERGWEFLCADPIDIPDLTDYLLSNLKAIPVQPEARSTESKAVQVQLEARSSERPQKSSYSPQAALDTLPVELLSRITSYLPGPTILHLHSANRALSARISLGPSFWRDQMISGTLLPFIWDLDAEKCREKDSNPPADTAWDWELLARTLKTEPFLEIALKKSLSGPLASLSRPSPADMGRIHLNYWRWLSKDAKSQLNGSPPLGLVNRVRIVRIIEEAMILGKEKRRISNARWYQYYNS